MQVNSTRAATLPLLLLLTVILSWSHRLITATICTIGSGCCCWLLLSATTSVARKTEELAWPDFTSAAFKASAKVMGTIERMCRTIMAHCTGVHTQYNSTQVCRSHLRSLPLVDPSCAKKYGPNAAKGSSLLCKYLHTWMVPNTPELHCYHAGILGLPDANGSIKCSPHDCDTAQVAVTRDVAPCTATDAQRVTVGTIHALRFCLLDLGSDMCSDNCTQAWRNASPPPPSPPPLLVPKGVTCFWLAGHQHISGARCQQWSGVSLPWVPRSGGLEIAVAGSPQCGCNVADQALPNSRGVHF